MIKETDLYLPVKKFLQAQGYEVKSEVKGCDVVALKPNMPTVVVELKLVFSLELVLQGVDRLDLSDDVYLAVCAPDTPSKRKNWRARQKSGLKLCRRLGLGLMHVTTEGEAQGGFVQVLLDPAPYTPRKNKKKETKLVSEFKSRAGDPNTGGAVRTSIMTAYRQNALRCAHLLSDVDEMKVSAIRDQAGVPNAATILQKNHYGWFERVSRGHYALTETGQLALKDNADMTGTVSTA
jgi:hypothetical protein